MFLGQKELHKKCGPWLVEKVQHHLISLPSLALAVYFYGKIIDLSVVDPKYVHISNYFIGIFFPTQNLFAVFSITFSSFIECVQLILIKLFYWKCTSNIIIAATFRGSSLFSW